MFSSVKVTLNDYEVYLNCCLTLTTAAMGTSSTIVSSRPCQGPPVGIQSHKPFPTRFLKVRRPHSKICDDLIQHQTSDHLFTPSCMYSSTVLESARTEAFKRPALQVHSLHDPSFSLPSFLSVTIVQEVRPARCCGAAVLYCSRFCLLQTVVCKPHVVPLLLLQEVQWQDIGKAMLSLLYL